VIPDDAESGAAVGNSLQSAQDGGPLRIAVYKYPPPIGSTDGGAGSDGIDDWVVPWSPARDALYPDDWVVPWSAERDALYPNDWIVPAKGTAGGPDSNDSAVPAPAVAASSVLRTLNASSGVGSGASAGRIGAAASFPISIPAPLLSIARNPLLPSAAQMGATAWDPPIFPGDWPAIMARLFPTTVRNAPLGLPDLGTTRGVPPIQAVPSPNGPSTLWPQVRVPQQPSDDYGDLHQQSLLQSLPYLRGTLPPDAFATTNHNAGIDSQAPSSATYASASGGSNPPGSVGYLRGSNSGDGVEDNPSISPHLLGVGTNQFSSFLNALNPIGAANDTQGKSRPLGGDRGPEDSSIDQNNKLQHDRNLIRRLTLSQVTSLTKALRNTLEFFDAYVRDGAYGLSLIPADLEGMANDAVTDFPEFLRRAEPSLAGLGLSMPMTRAAATVWKLNDITRGRVLEMLHGANMPFTYPTVDRTMNGIATSIKSINLDGSSYQKAGKLVSTLREYINDIANFTPREWAGADLEPDEIASRGLDVIVPHGGSAAQQSEIEQAIKYGARQNVTVNVIQHP
jgi:hypothetical protein